MSTGGNHNELYELYVMGLLEEPERSMIEADLRRKDPAAHALLQKALETNAIIGTLAPDILPPKRLRKRIISIAEPHGSQVSWKFAWVGLSAALVAGLIYAGVQRRNLEDELRATQTSLERTSEALAVREASLALLRRPDTRLLTTGGAGQAPVAKVFLNSSHGVLLMASNLPQLPAGQTYEMWVVPKVGVPRPAGLFKPDSKGSAIHLHSSAVDVEDAAAIALSQEPDGGSPRPTTTPFLITPVGD